MIGIYVLAAHRRARRKGEADASRMPVLVRAVIAAMRAVPAFVASVFGVLAVAFVVAGSLTQAGLAVVVVVLALSVAIRVALLQDN
jgi:hypothetical protein